MRPITEIAGVLRWLKPKRLKSDYELRAGDDLVATLVWTRGSTATGQTAAAAFRFSRHGWFRPRILVHEGDGTEDAAPNEPTATFTQRGGMLNFPDGRTFTWKKPKRWTNERIWADASATERVRFSPSRTQTTVTVASPAAPELPLLIPLGQYLLVLAQQDAAAASTAATTAVIASS